MGNKNTAQQPTIDENLLEQLESQELQQQQQPSITSTTTTIPIISSQAPVGRTSSIPTVVSAAPVMVSAPVPVASFVAPAQVFVDVATGKPHQFTVGENVVVQGIAQNFAQSNQYEDVAKITSINGPNVSLQFFKSGTPAETEGGVGIPSGSIQTYPTQGNIKPLPIYTQRIDQQRLKTLVEQFTCGSTNKDQPWVCDSCAPSGTLFGANEVLGNRDAIVAALTKVDGPIGNIRYTMFTCPTQINIINQPISPSNPLCKPVIISTVQLSNGTNRYSIIGTPDTLAFQSAVLSALGLPQSGTYLNSIPWSQISQYKQLVSNLENSEIPCYDVDNVWLYNKINDLLQRGYQQASINLLV